MAAGAPWSVKGIDPKAREVAKDLARRSGMTLGEWLNHVILEDELPEDVTSEDHFTARPFRGGPEMQSPFMSIPAAPQRPDWTLHKSDDLGRIALALGKLTDRIEASETRTGLAITSVEHSVREAMARIDTAERDRLNVAARLEGAAGRAADDHAQLSERLRRLEAENTGPRSAEAIRMLEQSVAGRLNSSEQGMRETVQQLEARIARAESGVEPAALIEEVAATLGERLAGAEGRTTSALESLRGTLSELDSRIRATEGAARDDLDQRLAALADQLSQRVEDARSEITARLAITPQPRMEARLDAMAAHAAAAEQRSARAIQEMGREVLTLAESLSRRVQNSEQRTATAIENVGGEMARIAGAVEQRLGRVDQVHAEALERLGEEIGRITDRLTDRIIQSERRAAQAIDDVGDQVSRVTERIEQRYERISSDLAERIRQSEERTARLLEEARNSLDQRSGAIAHAEPEAEAAAEPVAVRAPMTVSGIIPRAMHADPMSAILPAAFAPDLLSRAEPINQPALDPERPAFSAEDFEAADGFAPISDLDSREPEPSPQRHRLEPVDDIRAAFTAAPPVFSDEFDQPPPPRPAFASDPPMSTREVIDQARAAARAAKPPPENRLRPPSLGILQALKPGRPTSTWQTALLVAGGAAFLSVGAAGVVLMDSPGRQNGPNLPFEFAPRAAIALAPAPVGQTATGGQYAAPRAAPPPQASADFIKIAAAVERGEPGSIVKLRELAETGQPAAQLYLAGLYEKGGAGVKPNMAEARRWTERAALIGDPKAMHNLALYYFRGEGGDRDTASAARWFRKAAERGVVDSQYNLGLLYQAGAGVERNLAEAYKWFSIAADGGDGTARASAISLESGLSAAQIATATKQAQAFQPIVERPAPKAQANADPDVGPAELAAAQRILGKLGYYRGGADGSASREFAVALSTYQRDQGLAATGALDAATAARLSAFAR